MLRITSLALVILWTGAYAQHISGIEFRNLTASAITSLKLSPAGKQEWGENQCENCSGSFAYNGRLKVSDVEPGVYDVKFRDNLHRECVLKNIDLRADRAISIEEKKLVGLCQMF